MPVEIAPADIEAHIRSWLDTFEVGTRKVNNEKLLFGLEVTLKDARKVFITRYKGESSKYIWIEHLVTVSDEHKEALLKLDSDKRDQFKFQLMLELAKSNVQGEIADISTRMALVKRLPITSLSEGTMLIALDEMLAASNIVISVYNLSIPQNAHKK